jgi:hypothetical protein
MSEGAEEAPPTGPLSERLVHKNWKWRAAAYEELEKVFQTAEDGNSRVFEEYGMIYYALYCFLYHLYGTYRGSVQENISR